jgi:cytochrome c oxidase cbb3-type subunit 4
MSIQELAGYGYVAALGISVLFLYWYIWHVHTDKKRGQDYEKYGRLALDDEITDSPIEKKDEKKGD